MIGVLVPVFLIQSGEVFQEIVQLKESLEERLNSQAQVITDLAGGAMVMPLWDFDMLSVQRVIDDLLIEENVERVVVEGSDGIALAWGQTPGFEQKTEDWVMSRILAYEQGGQSEALGRLSIVFSSDSVNETLKHLIIQKLLSSLSVLALIAVTLFAVFSKLVGPLNAMARTIGRISSGDLDTPIPGAGRSDEIGVLAQALEQWRSNEIEVRRLRARDTEDARRERRRIQRALQSTHDAVVVLDEVGKVVFCNENATAFFDGIEIGDGISFDAWLQLEAAHEVGEAVNRKQNFQIETSVMLPGAETERNLNLRVGPILDESSAFLGSLIIATDQTERARQAKHAKFLAEHDTLTNLPNRRLMEKTLARWAKEGGRDTSILLADLDHFKHINDTLGHAAGDALLCKVADALSSAAGPNELAARLGGDEFAVLARGPHSRRKLTKIAEFLIQTFSQPQQIDGRILHTGLSVGIATLGDEAGSSTDGLRRADLALYEAKEKGRGQFAFFHSKLEAVVQRKSLLEAELRKALDAKEIYPVFQMQTDLESGEIIGFEALARWHHKELGVISPGEFIPIAEEVGLITELTHQILQISCKAAAEWQELGFEGRVAVNLSPKLFGAEIAEFVSDCMLSTCCPGNALEVEITETVVMADGELALKEIKALQGLGVTVALDDFGMGYSSLSYLQKFPVNKIKIDRAFVSKLASSEEARAIVSAIADLGHALNMTVTGEGAETEDERHILHTCNVDHLQGFVDGKPLSRKEVRALISETKDALTA